MIAYVIRLTTAIFGVNEFGVRLGVCIASLGTLLCCFVLARRLFSARAGFLTVLLLSLTPLMAVGSQIATYDPLLVCFWSLTLVALERALRPGAEATEAAQSPPAPLAASSAAIRRGQRAAWLSAGIAAGCGLLSKHTMVLIVPCLAVFLVLSRDHRFWL